MPNQTVKNGLKAKKIKLPQMNFFLKKQLIKFSCMVQAIIITLIYLLAIFIVQNLKKKFLQQIQSYVDASFLGPKLFICLKQNFKKNY